MAIKPVVECDAPTCQNEGDTYRVMSLDPGPRVLSVDLCPRHAAPLRAIVDWARESGSGRRAGGPTRPPRSVSSEWWDEVPNFDHV